VQVQEKNVFKQFVLFVIRLHSLLDLLHMQKEPHNTTATQTPLH